MDTAAAAQRGAGLLGLALAAGGAAAVALGHGLPGWSALAAGVILAQALFVRFRPVRVPVVMLHSVAGFRPDRPEPFSIWCPPLHFEGYLKYLKRRGFHTITLQELHGHLAKGAPLPAKPIVLTFDDGYLDNWVYAAPLLAKYGFKGTIFVASDFVQRGGAPRITIEDVWEGRFQEADLQVFGYLNEAEIKALADSGVMDIQSHGKTHTWLPSSEEIVDFHHPGLPLRHLRWMWWNRHPQRKPFWFSEISPLGVPWGAPVYKNALALSRPALVPDPGLEARLIAFVASRGGSRFFEAAGWREELHGEVARYRAEHPPEAPLEDTPAFLARLRGELEGSRAVLEGMTGRPVRFMCWPNGGTCREAFDLLPACGYLAATLPSRAKQPINRRGNDPARIGRISATSFFRGTPKVWPWVLSFALKVERNRGLLYAGIPIKAIWVLRRFLPPGGGVPPGAEE